MGKPLLCFFRLLIWWNRCACSTLHDFGDRFACSTLHVFRLCGFKVEPWHHFISAPPSQTPAEPVGWNKRSGSTMPLKNRTPEK